jgi:hypothetical protein
MRSLLLLVVFLTALLLLAPKKELYFALEKRLEPQGILLGDEKIQPHLLSLDIEGVHLYYQGIDIGRVGKIAITPYLLVNRIVLEDFSPAKGLEPLQDLAIQRATVLYRLWHPRILLIRAEGTFGSVRGKFDLSQHKLFLRWTRMGSIQTIRPYLKKDEEGWYYEQTF